MLLSYKTVSVRLVSVVSTQHKSRRLDSPYLGQMEVILKSLLDEAFNIIDGLLDLKTR